MHTRKLMSSTIGSLLRASEGGGECESGLNPSVVRRDKPRFPQKIIVDSFFSSCFCGYRFRTCYSIQAKVGPVPTRPKNKRPFVAKPTNAISFAHLFVVANSTIADTKMTISVLLKKFKPFTSKGTFSKAYYMM